MTVSYKFRGKVESLWLEVALLYIHKAVTAVRMVAAERKSMKYSNLPTHHFFQTIAVDILETFGLSGSYSAPITRVLRP